MNKIIFITVFVFSAALGLTIWAYGDAKFNMGTLTCKADTAAAAVIAGNEAATNLDKVINETAHMSDDDVDADLRDLGIMRPDALR